MRLEAECKVLTAMCRGTRCGRLPLSLPDLVRCGNSKNGRMGIYEEHIIDARRGFCSKRRPDKGSVIRRVARRFGGMRFPAGQARGLAAIPHYVYCIR